MKYKILIIICLVLTISIFGCQQAEEQPKEETGLPNPASVYCEEQGGTLRMEQDEKGTHGICVLPDGTECEEWAYFRGECPKKEPTEEEFKEEPKKEMTEEIKELLTKHEKVKSLAYNYRKPDDPDKVYRFAIKGNKIRMVLPGSKYLKEDEYNAIYFDTELKTAEAYCDDNILCKTRGKRKDLDYEKNYMDTPIDWIKKVTYAEKLSEELVESRPTWKLDTDIGTMLIEVYYGVPYEVRSEEKTYRFEDVSFNSVQDSDVTPT